MTEMLASRVVIVETNNFPLHLCKVSLAVSFLLFFLLSVESSINADVHVYKDKNRKFNFTQVCSEQQLKAGCQKIIHEGDRLRTPEEEQDLREILPQYDVSDEQTIDKPGMQFITQSRQWQWESDSNRDGKLIIRDVSGWVKWAFYYPGDWVIDELLKRRGKAAEFLELTSDSYGGRISLLISLVALPFAIYFVLLAFIMGIGGFLTICDAAEQAVKRTKFPNRTLVDDRHLPKLAVKLLEKLRTRFDLPRN